MDNSIGKRTITFNTRFDDIETNSMGDDGIEITLTVDMFFG